MLVQKTKAAAVHFLFSMAVVTCAAGLVFYFWFPGELSSMLGGVKLFLLVAFVDVLLGPVISLVIFNPNKPRAELVKDYSVVVCLQLAALSYGLYAVAQSRPVFMVFVKDRVEVVTAIELDKQDFEEVSDSQLIALSWSGPKRVCVEPPTSQEDKSDLLFSAVAGKDIQLFPKYYRSCRAGEVLNKAYSEIRLMAIIKQQQGDINIVNKLPTGKYSWLPIKHRFGVWVEVYPEKDIKQALLVSINPFD